MRLSPLLLGLACLGMAGCAQQVSLKRMHLDNQELARQVVALDSLLRAREAEDERRWIEESTDADDLKKQVQQVQDRLDNVARRLADLAKDLEAVRLSSGSKGRPSVGRPAAAVPADSDKNLAPLLADPQELYNLARKDMDAGSFSLALTEFSQVLDNFPQSEFADNACYWLGECYYAQKDFPKAAEAFQRLLKDYPQGEKVPGALLKLGYALAEQKDQVKAAAAPLREVIEKFPDSPEAKLAKEKLKALGPPAKPAGKRR